MNLREIIDSAFPIVADNELAMLDLVAIAEKHGYLHLVLKLMVFERRDGGLRVTDIKEQQVRFVAIGEPAWRVERYLNALTRVLVRVLVSVHDVGPVRVAVQVVRFRTGRLTIVPPG